MPDRSLSDFPSRLVENAFRTGSYQKNRTEFSRFQVFDPDFDSGCDAEFTVHGHSEPKTRDIGYGG